MEEEGEEEMQKVVNLPAGVPCIGKELLEILHALPRCHLFAFAHGGRCLVHSEVNTQEGCDSYAKCVSYITCPNPGEFS
jgi:hypothetical protein